MMDSLLSKVEKASENEESFGVTCNGQLGEIASNENILMSLKQKLMRIQRQSKDCQPVMMDTVALKHELS